MTYCTSLYSAHNVLLRILFIFACVIFVFADSAPPATTIRWASTGGGWRAQFADVGFANLFAKVGVFSHLSAISTTSGASWFSTQLFYSKAFYDRVVLAEDSQSLHDFVVDWMDSYGDMLENAIENSTLMSAALEAEICNVTDLGEDDFEIIQVFSDLCHTMVYFQGDWALLVDEMLVAAAKSYGDVDFGTKSAGRDNRLDAMKDTDLLIQTALVPNSRIRDRGSENDIAVYLGPNDKTLYTYPISVAYVVDSTGTKYRYAMKSSDLIPQTSEVKSMHSFEDWERFHLYPAENGTDAIISKGYVDGTSNGILTYSEAFGGGDSSVIQVAAISSAAAGTFSPLVPSVFTQGLSDPRYQIKESFPRLDAKAFEQAVEHLYNESILDGFAVCSQWPNPCGQTDGIFVDGWISDNPALAINVGQYHIAGGDLSTTMKVILTNTNQEWGDKFQYTQMLQYFNSPINEGVEPGSFNWPPGMWVPYQSPQLFSEFLNESMLDGLIEPITGSNMTTAILKGTTLQNSIFGIEAEQKVEILLINTNEPITTYIVTPDVVQQYTEPLASMTTHIADNEELASRIKAFVGQTKDEVSSSGGLSHSTVPVLSSALFALVILFMLA